MAEIVSANEINVINSKARLEYIDMAKGIGIILVILGHIVYTQENILIWISSFHMPLFFLIAGIMIAVKDRDVTNLKAEILHRAHGIMIPYMWFSIIDFVLDIGNLALGKIEMDTFIYNIISSCTFYGKSVLWFLAALFLSEIYFIFIKSFLKKDFLGVLVIVAVAAIAYLCKLGLDSVYSTESIFIRSLVNFCRVFVRAAVVLPFVGAGYYIWKYCISKYEAVINAQKVKEKLAFGTVGMLLIAIGVIISIVNKSVDTNNMILGNPFLYYLGGLTGSIGMILICIFIPAIRPIKYFGRNSLVIMATHLDCYILWAGLKVSMLIFGLIPLAPVLVICTVIFTMIFSCIPVELINRYFPFIVGKKRGK